jgi:hypothetical protein
MRKLPTSIQILGNTITVEHVDNLAVIGDRFGDWNAAKNLIRVQSLGQGIPNDVCFAAYYHELTHAILELSGHSELSADEALTERLGQAYYQASKSKKFS